MNERSLSAPDALVRAFAARPPTPAVRTHCPEPEELFDAASGGLPETRRLQVVDHLAVCAECTTAWRLRDALQTAAAPRRGSASWNTWSLAAAAGLALAVGAVLMLRDPLPQPVPVYRDGTRPAAEAPLILQSRVASETLPRAAFRLRWAPGAADATYTIRVTDTALAPVAVEQGLAEPEFLVPAATLADIPAGEAVLWQVEMRRPDGTGAVSPTYSTRVE